MGGYGEYKGMVKALLDQHLEFVAYDDCQFLVRKAWLQCDITGRVLPWSTAGQIERALYILLSLILLFPRILLFIGFAAVYHMSGNREDEDMDDIEVDPWKVMFFLYFYIPFNRFLSHVMMHFIFMVLVILTILNPQDIKDELDWNWYDVLILILSFSYVFMDIGKICKYNNTIMRGNIKSNVWVYNLFFHGLIFLGTILKGVGYYIECESDIEGCEFHEPYLVDSRKSMVVYGYCIFAVGAVLGCLKMLHWTHMSHTLGPVVVCVRKTAEDILSMVPVFLILYFAFTIGIYYIMELVEDQVCANEFDGILDRTNQTWKIDDNINQWKPHRVENNRFPARNAAKYSLWSLFDPGHTEGFGCTSGYPVYVAASLWWIYQVVIVLICMNLVIASMNATIQRVQEFSHEQWKFARTEIWIEFFDKRSRLPVPFNVGESLFYWLYDSCKEDDQPETEEQPHDRKKEYIEMVESLCKSYNDQRKDSYTNKITKEVLENSKKRLIKELQRSSQENRA